MEYHRTLRTASHCGRRLRGHRFPPIRLLKTKNSTARPFTLEAKVQRTSLSKMPIGQHFSTKVTNFRKMVGSHRHGNPNYAQEVVGCLNKNIKIWQRSWPLDWRGCFGQWINWDALSSFGLWAWPLEASHSALPWSNSYILLATFNPFLWTLNKV
jgi:hypothetical protein